MSALQPADCLPGGLAERCRVLADAAVPATGRYVLLWAHHALRDHDNPCLDTALQLATRLQSPVLAYAGLHGAHPHASDRHHMFILQSLREWQTALAARGVTALVSLPLAGRPSPLPALVAEAAAVVVEDMPVDPLRRWTGMLAARAAGPAWAVDARCIVPMTLSERAPTRAFEFRRRFAGEYARRVPLAWPAAPPARGEARPPRGIESLWLADEDLGELLAACAIDHSVPPVADTPGGMQAAVSRWQAFRDHGLRDYHRLRNDAAIAPPAGVSRLSPYLHYGCLSPFALAREAHGIGGPGAEKFLDELLIWRELAHHFCQHTAAPDSLQALPGWARESLLAAAADPREHLPGHEALARAHSGSALWDLAQTSLLRHGELHNNLRMTWGKALPAWTRDPAEALALLLDLNHRYALDGSDPNSYGGLLWCLGLFDRPFEPAQQVLGRVRPRPIEAHAARLDLAAYRRRVSRPNGRRLRVAVIGAGAAGAMAARALADQGHAVEVFDKSRGPGGRMATRRAGELAFDHGAQYLTLRDPRLGWLRDAWAAAGLIAPWQAAKRAESTRWVAVPGMNALARHLLDGRRVAWSTQVTGLAREGATWQLLGPAGEVAEGFDRVLVALPAPQAAALLGDHTDWRATLSTVGMAPCWAVMLADLPARPALPSDCWREPQADAGGPLAWFAHDGAKPGRGRRDTWVLHAGETWSREHLDDPAEGVAEALWEAFARQLGLPAAQRPGHLVAHRWRYARVVVPLGTDCLWSPASGLGACGDWCLGARVEAALLSGIALAGRVMVDASGQR